MSNKKLFGWLDFGGSIAGVAANVLSTILTNKKNEQLARQQNAFQRQENELAYQRAKPQNQVSQMMQAGMSKAGALNAINGGATYQPAPISSATAQAPQIDLTSAFDGLLQIGENAKQRKMQEDMLQKNIDAAVAAQQKQFEENERQRKHDLEMQSREHTNTNRNVDNRLAWEKEIYDRLPAYEQKRYDLGTELLEKQVDMEKWRVNDLKYRTLEYQSKPYKTTRDTMNLLQEVSAELDLVVSDKELKEFKDTYMYYDSGTDEWKYKEIGNNPASNWVYKNAPLFWDFISRVVPANKLADLIARGLSKK